MKKFIIGILALILMLSLCGCGNMSLGMGSYEFNKVHVDTYHYSGCLEVEAWYDNGSTGVEVKTKDYGNLFLAEGTYTMIEDDCPFCAHNNGSGVKH